MSPADQVQVLLHITAGFRTAGVGSVAPFMEAGRIVAKGGYDELVRDNERFRAMLVSAG